MSEPKDQLVKSLSGVFARCLVETSHMEACHLIAKELINFSMLGYGQLLEFDCGTAKITITYFDKKYNYVVEKPLNIH